MKIKFIAIIIIAGFVLGSFSISNNVNALSDEIGKIVPSDTTFPPSSPPGLEKAGMVRVISSTTSEKGISDIAQKGCTVIHKLNQVTSFFCPTQIVDTLENVRPVKIYQTHDMYQVQQIQADRVWNELGFDGTGVTVAVLDTGVQISHAELTPPGEPSAIFTTSDFTGEGGDYLDYQGHGTHVSGIIAGNGVYNIQGTSNKANGVTDAQTAILIVGKVCGNFGCPEDAILAGIAWAQNQGADVINMSLGGGLDSRPDCDTAIDPNDPPDSIVVAVNNAAANGVVVVISSGNDSNKNAVSYPGCASGAIAVGAVDINDQDASFSNAGPAMDIVAPGVSTLSSWSCNASPTLSCASTWYYYASGTSMASPHVAGVVALMLDKNPNLTVDQVKNALYSTAVPVGPNDGNGRVDAYAAVNSVSGVTNPPSNDSDGDGFDDVNLGGTDCDDTDDTIFPGAIEILNDGIDQNCNGNNDEDEDGDGVTVDGGDCDDLDNTRYLGATEIPDNEIDEDCNGSDTISVHVEDLTWEATNKKNWKVDIFITVHGIDADHSSVSGVSVQGTLTGGGIVNCTTDGSGTCKITKTTRLGQLTFTVDSLSGSDFVLLILDPHDLDEDSNIDVLTVTIDRGSSFGEDTPPDDTPEDPPQDKCNPGMQKKNLC